MLRICVLVDNRDTINNDDPCLQSEHGLSLFIDVDGYRILCDMGASAVYRQNACEMGIDLTDVDCAFVSHGHNDHTGGLGDFLQNVPDTKVILSPAVFAAEYFSTRRGVGRNISTDAGLLSEYSERFDFADKSRWLSSNVAIVKCEVKDYSFPVGNKYLYKGLSRDRFDHELSLAITTRKGLVVVSSCSHCGAMNIMESCRRFTEEKDVCLYIGGLHFIESEDLETEVADFAADIDKYCSSLKVITGHCTCDRAIAMLRERNLLDDVLSTGKLMEIEL